MVAFIGGSKRKFFYEVVYGMVSTMHFRVDFSGKQRGGAWKTDISLPLKMGVR